MSSSKQQEDQMRNLEAYIAAWIAQEEHRRDTQSPGRARARLIRRPDTARPATPPPRRRSA
jgi:hypothetical protein